MRIWGIIIICLISLSFLSAIDYDDCNIYGNCKSITSSGITFNNNTGSVNDSNFLQGLTPQQVADLFSETDPYYFSNPRNYINVSEGMDYTNVAMLNESNLFVGEENVFEGEFYINLLSEGYSMTSAPLVYGGNNYAFNFDLATNDVNAYVLNDKDTFDIVAVPKGESSIISSADGTNDFGIGLMSFDVGGGFYFYLTIYFKDDDFDNATDLDNWFTALTGGLPISVDYFQKTMWISTGEGNSYTWSDHGQSIVSGFTTPPTFEYGEDYTRWVNTDQEHETFSINGGTFYSSANNIFDSAVTFNDVIGLEGNYIGSWSSIQDYLDLSSYLTQATADGLYYSLGNPDGYLTSVNLATQVTGVLPITNGGTGVTSFTPSSLVEIDAGGNMVFSVADKNNLHTHENKANLDTINQAMGTANSVSFNQITATNDLISVDDIFIGDQFNQGEYTKKDNYAESMRLGYTHSSDAGWGGDMIRWNLFDMVSKRSDSSGFGFTLYGNGTGNISSNGNDYLAKFESDFDNIRYGYSTIIQATGTANRTVGLETIASGGTGIGYNGFGSIGLMSRDGIFICEDKNCIPKYMSNLTMAGSLYASNEIETTNLFTTGLYKAYQLSNDPILAFIGNSSKSGTTAGFYLDEYNLATPQLYFDSKFGIHGNERKRNDSDFSWNGYNNVGLFLINSSENSVSVNGSLIQTNGNSTINGNLNVTGTIDTPNYYAEGWNGGNGTYTTMTVSNSYVWYNYTNWTQGDYNEFSWSGTGVDVEHDGMYVISGTITITGGNGGDYAFAIFLNDVPQQDCSMGATASTNVKQNIGINCLKRLSVGDHLDLKIQDRNNPAQDIRVWKINMNTYRIGQ